MSTRERVDVELVGEVLLIALSLMSVVGCFRLFADWSFFWRLTACAVGSHAVAVAARRAHLSTAAAVGASTIAVCLLVAWTMYWSTTALGIPTPDTLATVRDDLAHTIDTFNAVRAPAPVSLPLLLPAGLFLWWAAFVADWAAFRLRFGFEALVPLASVFLFSSLIGERRAQVPLTGAFVALALAFLVVRRIADQQSSGAWIGRDGSDGPGSLLRAGAGFVAGAALLAAVVGPLVPGSDAKALYELRPGPAGAGSSRTVTSPLVEIKKRLVEQTNLELFTVRTDVRAYWRLTALDTFDGNLWSSNGSYDDVDGSLPSADGRSGPSTEIHQSFAISNLQSPWLPAAFEARHVEGAARITWSPALSTLIVGGQSLTADGTTYTVVSSRPDIDPEALRSADPAIPKRIASADLALPADLPAAARQEAARVTAGLTGAYDKALALQQWFRTEFTYDQTVDTDNSNDAITAFLDSRRGYCQQFAGTFAAMARFLGLPARVAVGFTPGEADPSDPTLLHVKGVHAHAWPEVWFAGQGWVAFEPTPGRGIPGASSYTGVTEEQATPAGGATTETVPATTEAPATSAPTGGSTPTTAPREQDQGSTSTGGGEPFLSTWPGRALLVLVAAALVAVAWALGVPALRRHRRRRRREAASTPDAKVEVAWAEGLDAVALLGLAPERSETPAEFATRADPTVDGEPWARLADLLVTAEFADFDVEAGEAEEAYALAEAIDGSVRARLTRADRWRAELDPRRGGRSRGGTRPPGPARQAGGQSRRRERGASAPRRVEVTSLDE